MAPMSDPLATRAATAGAAPLRTALLTSVAMVAFALNSILCRAALRPVEGEDAIDPASFAAIRIAAGAAALAPFLLRAHRSGPDARGGGPAGALALVAYAAGFAYSYVTLPAGAGALLLFGAVQLTMVAAGLASGERLGARRGLGAAAAAAGLVWLVAPTRSDAASLDATGAILMVVAGVAWGVYSLLGRAASAPTVATARNFALGLPLALLPLAFVDPEVHARGVWLAVASGAITSGLGYAVWYTALRGLGSITAALAQLTVPVIAASLGAAFLGEEVTPRLVGASALVLGGVALGVLGRRSSPAAR